MFPFNWFPGTSMHDLDLDWLIKTVKEMHFTLNDFVSNFSNPELAYSGSEMTNKKLIYLYVGDEYGYEKNHWYYYNADLSAWTDGGLYGSAVVDDDFSTTSGNAVKNSTITNYLNPEDNSASYLTPYTINGEIMYDHNFITPEMFGAAGDLSLDDSAAIKECIEHAITNGESVLMTGNYKIDNPITINANSAKCNIVCFGYLQANAQMILRGFVNSNILLKCYQGGTGSLTSPGITIEKGGYNNIELYANEVTGLAFQIGGSSAADTMTNFNKCSVFGWGNLCTLHHGDGVNKQWAFGTYVNIYDYNPTYPIVFQKSNDITILHVENLFTDATHTKHSIEFIDCDLVNVESLAIGGTASYLGYIEDSRMHINYLFVNSEDPSSSRVTNGLLIKGKSVVSIDYTTSGNIPIAVTVKDLTNEAGANWRPAVYMKDGFVYNPSTDKLIDVSNAGSPRVGCYDQQITPTKVHSNIGSFSGGYTRIGQMVFINMKMNLSSQITAGGLQVLFSDLPPHDPNFGTDISISSSAQMFSVSKLGESSGSLYLPAGQALTSGDNYIIGSYVALR